MRIHLLAFLLLLQISTSAQESLFKVGAAKRDVTPKEPVPMWGYGARKARLSEGTLDPLLANIVVIQAGETKVAIVGTDLGRSPGEGALMGIRQRIKQSCGIEISFVSGSHAHHGPVMELTNEPGKGQGKFDAALRFYKEMEDAIVSGIEEANRQLVPAKMAVGSVKLENFNRNRHTKIEPKPIDRDLSVMRFDSVTENKTIAVLVNWAAHPTMISAGIMKFSPDYVGALKQTVEQEMGGVAVFMQGAGGDLSAANNTGGDYKVYGQALGTEVVKLAKSLQPQPVTSPSLVFQEDRFTYAPRINMGNPVVRAVYESAFFPELVANFVSDYEKGVQPRLTLGLLNGEVALVGGSGEFFANHAIRLKERARVKQLFFFGYCNGYHQYFPTIEAVAEGGYGADTTVSPVAVGAGEEMMNKALIWIYQKTGKIKN